MTDSKKITELTASLPSGSFDFAVASGVENYKIFYSDLAEYSSIGTKSGNFTETLMISGNPVATGEAPPGVASGLSWSGAPASSSSPGESGAVSFTQRFPESLASTYFYTQTASLGSGVVDAAVAPFISWNSLFLTSNGDAYGCGRNDAGQLGLGDLTQREVPTYITGGSVGSSVTGIAADGIVSFFLATNGDAYGCGRRLERLGLGGGVPLDVVYPTRVTGSNIVAIAVGGDSTLFLASNGDAYGCGVNNYGQLGLGDTAARWYPTLISGSTITGISAAGYFYHDSTSLFVTSAGDVYGCGENNTGQLGLGDVVQRNWPTLITGSTVVKAKAGTWNSLFLTAAGDVYGCGLNYNGLLGQGDSGSSVPITRPTYITGAGDGVAVSEVALGKSFSLFLNTAGDVYGCGSNNDGALGLGGVEQVAVPTFITGALNGGVAVTGIRGGGFDGLGESLFLTVNGDVYGCGRNTYSSLGLGDTTMRTVPTAISGAQIPIQSWKRLSLSTW